MRFFFLSLIIISNIFCNEILFEGFNSTIYKNHDRENGIFSGLRNGKYDFEAISFTFDSPNNALELIILSPNDFVLSLKEKSKVDYNFSSTSNYLIKAGEQSPLRLKKTNSTNTFILHDKSKSRRIIKSFLSGEKVKVKFLANSSNGKDYEVHMINKSSSYVYGKAVKLFGWKDKAYSDKLPKPKIKTSFTSKNITSAVVLGNEHLNIQLFQDGECYLALGEKNISYKNQIFNYKRIKNKRKKVWITNIGNPDKYLIPSIIISNEKGKVLFNEKAPQVNMDGQKWGHSKNASRIAWDAYPYGSIEVTGKHRAKESLYGFRELWNWGVKMGCFPEIRESK